jgi:hypothetical protein
MGLGHTVSAWPTHSAERASISMGGEKGEREGEREGGVLTWPWGGAAVGILGCTLASHSASSLIAAAPQSLSPLAVCWRFGDISSCGFRCRPLFHPPTGLSTFFTS